MAHDKLRALESSEVVSRLATRLLWSKQATSRISLIICDIGAAFHSPELMVRTLPRKSTSVKLSPFVRATAGLCVSSAIVCT